MNKRINELFEQALEEFNAENKYATIIVPNPLKEKFAELIVQECMQVVANQLPSNQYLDVAHAVIEHFGVEE